MDDMCKANNGRCNHEGVGCMEWNKPLWFESISLYLAQIGEFQKSDTPENERKCVLSDEIFGVKAYIKSTQLQIKRMMLENLEDQVLQQAFKNSKMANLMNHTTSLMNIFKTFDWRIFK